MRAVCLRGSSEVRHKTNGGRGEGWGSQSGAESFDGPAGAADLGPAGIWTVPGGSDPSHGGTGTKQGKCWQREGRKGGWRELRGGRNGFPATYIPRTGEAPSRGGVQIEDWSRAPTAVSRSWHFSGSLVATATIILMSRQLLFSLSSFSSRTRSDKFWKLTTSLPPLLIILVFVLPPVCQNHTLESRSNTLRIYLLTPLFLLSSYTLSPCLYQILPPCHASLTLSLHSGSWANIKRVPPLLVTNYPPSSVFPDHFLINKPRAWGED